MDQVIVEHDLVDGKVDAIHSSVYFSDIFSSEKIIQLCKSEVEHVIIITDDNVGPLYAQDLLSYLHSHQIKAQVITVPSGEGSKSRETKSVVEDKMFALGCGRDTLMIALGGGVITDLTGFIASTYCRGVPVIYLPTSLLAMVDAAMGGKTGINTPHGKNLIGTFSDPKAIFIDVKCLNTLPDHEYIQAFSEIIKHALIDDSHYFKLIESSIKQIKERDSATLVNIIKRSCEIKLNIVSEDQKEKSKREILNFGHTIGHALETSSKYAISHGQAVAIGIIVESYLSNQMGLLPREHFHRIKELFSSARIPTTFQAKFSKEDLLKAFYLDKKTRKQQYRFVLLERIGEVAYFDGSYAHAVDLKYVEDALDYLFKHCVS